MPDNPFGVIPSFTPQDKAVKLLGALPPEQMNALRVKIKEALAKDVGCLAANGLAILDSFLHEITE